MPADDQLRQRLRALFAEELDEGLELLVQGLLKLEREAATAPGADLVQELFRTAHSLKGAAHAASVPEAVGVCDRLETAFAAVRDGHLAADEALVTRLLAETDTLSSLTGGLREDPVPAAVTAPGLSPSSPATTGPSGAPLVAEPSFRIPAGKVDAVLRHAGEGLAASRRLHEVVAQAALVADQVTTASAGLHPALKPAGADGASHQLASLLDAAARAATALARSVEVADRALHQASSGVAAAVQQLRTQPFRDACRSLDRAARDVAARSGKSVRVRIVGEDVDVDRAVVSALRDPLLHLVRNAVDHGVEAPAAREAAGKPATATVEVVAVTDGSTLTVTVRDDGAGIDLERLREAASASGVPMPLDDLELAFVPGLSTRGEVTAVSGRGVGLDAARARLEHLGGSLRVTTRPGVGTEVHLTTPLTLAVMRVVLVRAGNQAVALPTSSVDRVSQVPISAFRVVEEATLVSLDDRSGHAVSLAHALGFTADAPSISGPLIGVVVPRTGETVLVTDGLLDECEVAVRPLPSRLVGAPDVLGMTAEQGELPTLVVNAITVGRDAARFRLPTEPAPDRAAARVLLAEDAVTTRALERSLLEAAGYSVAVAVDGADAWQQLQDDGADLVVSDVDMPKMSGIELCRRIRSSARLRGIPVVLVTSLDSAADRQRGLEAGADAYVVKAELQHGSLVDAVARLL